VQWAGDVEGEAALPLVNDQPPVSASSVNVSASSVNEEPKTTGDSRIPPAGTVLRKVDRSGNPRCECVVVADGRIDYKGTVYRSLSAAAVAAARDLGLSSTSANGFAFWGVSKPARASGGRGRDPLQALHRAYEAYRTRVNALLPDDATEEARNRVLDTVKQHAAALARLGGRVA
jgi:hypothetical protein